MILKKGSFVLKKYKSILLSSILGYIVEITASMAASIISGLYLDADAVAATSLMAPLLSIIYFVSVLISMGTSITYSTELGAFNVEKSHKICGMGVLISIALGVLMSLVLFVGKDCILGFYNSTDAIMSYASDYYDAFIIIALIEPIYWLIYYLVAADGDDVLVTLADVGVALTTIVIPLLCINRMGISANGFGLFLSKILGVILLIPHLFKDYSNVKFKKYFSFKDLGNVLLLSATYSLTTLYIAVIDIIFNKFIIEAFNDSYLTAYAVVNAVLNFAEFLLLAYTAGCNFISVAYGENNPYAIRRLLKVVDKTGITVSICLTIIMFIVAPFWPDIYGITQPDVVNVAVFAGRIIPFSYLVTWFVYNYACYYPVMGNAFLGNIMMASYMLIAPLVFAIPLGLTFGFNGMTVGFFLTPILSVLVWFIYILLKKRIKQAPSLLSDSDEKEMSYDILLDSNSIIELRDSVAEFLREQDVSKKIINEVEMVLEDSLFYIMKKNDGKKIYTECTILLNQDHVRVITKDNGKVFNILKDADDSRDLQCYIMARMLVSAYEKANTTTISFNRNSYAWKR